MSKNKKFETDAIRTQADAVRQVGIEWCTAQSQELVKNGVPFLHYYSMGKSDNIHKVASAVF